MNGKAPALQFELTRALTIAGRVETTSWLLRPYVERRSLILMVGAEGTFKSFLALHWAMEIASAGEPVVYLSAEGRGMPKRLRAWCAYHRAGAPNAWVDTLHKLPFYAIERPVNLSDAETILALQAAIDAQGITPALIVIDTITRNSDGLVERSNEDFMQYLNLIDNGLRVKYGASVLLVHHVGHAAGERARGPSALSQATDANFLLTRPDPLKRVVTVKSGRMKDCEPPEPFEIEGELVTLNTVDEDGQLETSLAIKYTGNAPLMRKPLTGKAQKQLLAELERQAALPGAAGIWTETELRKIGIGLDMAKATARDAVHGLREHGYFTQSVGGMYLTHLGVKGVKAGESSNSYPALGGEKGVCSLEHTLSPSPTPHNGARHFT